MVPGWWVPAEDEQQAMDACLISFEGNAVIYVLGVRILPGQRVKLALRLICAEDGEVLASHTLWTPQEGG